MSKRTPLFPLHEAAGARLTDFGGWEMPLHYGSQIAEHHAVRREAGVFDVSHMLAVDLAGAGSTAFLRHLLANDVAKLAAPGRALYGCMLNSSGGVIDDLIVYRTATGHRLVVNAGTADTDLAWITTMANTGTAGVTVTPRRDLAILAVQGPLARERFWQARPDARAATGALAPFHAVETVGLFVARTGYTGEDGFEVMLPADGAADLWRALLAAGVTPCGLAARDTLRLEAGMNLYGHEMDAAVSPLDAGLAWTVDLASDRDFVGRAALEQDGARHAFAGLRLLDKGVPRAGQRVLAPAGEGVVTSGTFSPTLGFGIAMARLPLGTAAGTDVGLEIRCRVLPARVVALPFVRRGRALVH